ncbi:MAG: DUF222 domain-containing protein [Streptosporangiaceae bacterium]
MASRKLAATAELIRRSPASGCEQGGPGRMPGMWDEFAGDELASALAESRTAAGHLLDLAKDLAAKLPGTAAALRDGIISRYTAQAIANATALLDPAEAHAAEDKVLGRAVMEVAPKKAKEWREAAAKDARVERWAEDSGNAALMGCELPPDEVLAADQ